MRRRPGPWTLLVVARWTALCAVLLAGMPGWATQAVVTDTTGGAVRSDTTGIVRRPRGVIVDTTGLSAASAQGEGLRARPDDFAPTLLTVPGEAMLLDPPAALPTIPLPSESPDQQGVASWYGGTQFHGRKTASGERFDRHALTAAHPSLPFGTRVCVRSQVNGRGVVVRINDRGPHVPNRIIDLSEGAAKLLGMHSGLGLKTVALFTLEPGDTECADAPPPEVPSSSATPGLGLVPQASPWRAPAAMARTVPKVPKRSMASARPQPKSRPAPPKRR